MYLRKVQLILRSCNYASNIRHYDVQTNIDVTRSVANLIANHLNFTDIEAWNLMRKNRLIHQEYDEVKEVLKICNRLEFDKSELADNARILSRTPKTIEVQYIVLKEVGFLKVTPQHLLEFRKIMHMKICHLKKLKYIPSHLNVPETLIALLHPKPFEFNPGEFTEDNVLSQVHSAIVKNYLMWRLEATEDEVEKLFRINGSTMKLRSLRHICENIDLAFELGYTVDRLLKCSYVISAFPEYPKTILETMPTLAGKRMRTAMYVFPKLMTVPPTNVFKIYKMLKEAEISDSTIKAKMNVFTLSPNTVKMRLNEVKHIPEFNVFKKNTQLLQLIVHHNRARSRLTFLQQLQIKCASLTLLGRSESFFRANMREGKDVNKSMEVVDTLAKLLDSDKYLIEKNLKQHPYYLYVPLINLEENVKYLLTRYDKKTIINVLPIVLYSRHKIEAAFKNVRDLEIANTKRLNMVEKFNLALYYMEKEHHFTGNGIW